MVELGLWASDKNMIWLSFLICKITGNLPSVWGPDQNGRQNTEHSIAFEFKINLDNISFSSRPAQYVGKLKLLLSPSALTQTSLNLSAHFPNGNIHIPHNIYIPGNIDKTDNKMHLNPKLSRCIYTLLRFIT